MLTMDAQQPASPLLLSGWVRTPYGSEWDDDGNGQISKKEFGKALRALGVTSPKAEIDLLFDAFDSVRAWRARTVHGAARHAAARSLGPLDGRVARARRLWRRL